MGWDGENGAENVIVEPDAELGCAVGGPGTEEAGEAGLACSSGDGEESAAVDVLHLRDLHGFVGGTVLNDAHGVDPEVAQADAPCHGDGVLDGLGEGGDWDVGLVQREQGHGCFCRLVATPAVA